MVFNNFCVATHAKETLGEVALYWWSVKLCRLSRDKLDHWGFQIPTYSSELHPFPSSCSETLLLLHVCVYLVHEAPQLLWSSKPCRSRKAFLLSFLQVIVLTIILPILKVKAMKSRKLNQSVTSIQSLVA